MTGIQEPRPAQTTRWHVVTGGPSSGKTTTVNLLRGRGYTTTIEHARHYIDLQRITGRSTAEVRARQSEFQRAVVDMQIEQERSLDPQQTVFLDRALPDSLAYYRFLGLAPGTALLGAVLPDLDLRQSWAGRLLPGASGWLEDRFGHRTLTHSLLLQAGAGIAAWALRRVDGLPRSR